MKRLLSAYLIALFTVTMLGIVSADEPQGKRGEALAAQEAKPGNGSGAVAKPIGDVPVVQPQPEPIKHDVPPPIHALKGVIVPPFNADHLKFPRGLSPTPRHRLASAPRFKITGPLAIPAQVLMLPKRLDMWGNDTYGDCVTAQEAASKACYSVYCGLPETFIPTANVVSWARKYGFLNGANLDEVMNQMAKVGLTADDGKTYTDGPYVTVDYSNEASLKAAITLGPVNTGIDANALPSAAGNNAAWYAAGGRPGQFNNEDHCVPLVGFGTSVELFKQLSAVYGVNVPVPAGFPANGYLLFTWSTIGVVDHAWIMSTMGEAWVRNPTTPGQTPTPVPPTPVPPVPIPPTPTPTPSDDGITVIVKKAGVSKTYQLPLTSAGTIIWPTDTPQWLKDAVNTQKQSEMKSTPLPKKTSSTEMYREWLTLGPSPSVQARRWEAMYGSIP